MGCTSGPATNNEFKKREGDPALNSIFQQYYLSPSPEWLHYSFEGQCFIQESITYLNYEKLMKSFSFDYLEAVMTQKLLNKKMSVMTMDSKLGKMLLVDQHTILATIIERVRAANYTFLGDNISEVNIIWLDPIWNNLEKSMKQLAQKEKFYGGYPLWVSFCHSSHVIEKILNDRYQNIFSGIVLGAESFSIYNESAQRVPYRVLNFEQLVGKEKKLNLFVPQHVSRPKGFKGTFKHIFYY